MDNTHLNLVPKLRMVEAKRLLPLPPFMPCKETALTFYMFKPLVNADTTYSSAAASNLFVTAQHNASGTYCVPQQWTTVF